MEAFSFRGVVKNGQVILDADHEIPDGTVVRVTEYDTEEIATGPSGPLPHEVVKEMMVGLLKWTDLNDDPNWKEKIGRPRA